MVENKKFVQLQVAGTLYIPGINDTYYELLSPRPIRNVEGFDDGGPKKFYVASGPRSKARIVVVNGPYVIDYFSAGKMLEVEMSEQEEMEEEEPNDFQQIFSQLNFAIE